MKIQFSNLMLLCQKGVERKSKLGMSSRLKRTKVYEVDASKAEGTVQQGMNDRKAAAGQKDGPKWGQIHG